MDATYFNPTQIDYNGPAEIVALDSIGGANPVLTGIEFRFKNITDDITIMIVPEFNMHSDGNTLVFGFIPERFVGTGGIYYRGHFTLQDVGAGEEIIGEVAIDTQTATIQYRIYDPVADGFKPMSAGVSPIGDYVIYGHSLTYAKLYL